MHKTDGVGNVGGQFANENLALGLAASEVPADWLNAVQAELLNVVTAGGLAPLKADTSQVQKAIAALIANAVATRLALTGGTLTGNRPVTLDTNGGSVVFKGDAGGWGMGTYFRGSDGVLKGSFGALGGGASFSYLWAGLDYNSPWMTFSPTTVNAQVPLQQNGNQVLHLGNYNTYAPTLTGGGASGSWGVNITGTAANTILQASQDGDRTLATRLPTTTPRAVRYDFANGGSAGVGSRYAGVMTYSPWTGDTASTGDASYQMAFGGTVSDAGGMPMLTIRQGIDATWKPWYTLLHSGNAVNYSSGGVTLGAGAISSNAWAGTAGYPGYAYSGGNSRFGFSSSSGVVDVYTDGNFYATDSGYLVLHTNNVPSYAVARSEFRSFGTIVINPNGANATCTTAQFIAHLTSLGFFNYASATAKCSWDYAGNNDLTDTGFGQFELAGCVIETWVEGSAYKHVRLTRPTTGVGGFQVLVYNDQGASYAPGWRAMITSENVGLVMPTGGRMLWHSSAPPTGFLICDGSAVSRSAYASLFAAIGVMFGGGDGSSTFNLPDHRNRTHMGAGSTYGSGAVGGSADAIVVSHTHGATVSDPGHTHSIPTTGNVLTGGPNAIEDGALSGINYTVPSNVTGISVGISSSGQSGTGANLPPFIASYVIIKY